METMVFSEARQHAKCQIKRAQDKAGGVQGGKILNQPTGERNGKGNQV